MFTRLELVELARGARCLARQATTDKEKHSNPMIRDRFEDSVKYFEALVEKCERLAKIAPKD